MVKRKTNSIRITKCGKERVNELLESSMVNSYHKTLVKSVKHNAERKNLSKSDVDMLLLISNQYGGKKCKLS